MSARNFAVLSGPDSAKAALAVKREQDRRDQWPYPWEAAPPDATGKRIIRSQAVPVPATPTAIVTYQVPNAMKFVLRGIVIDYTGGGWVQGQGNALFSLTVNRPQALTTPQQVTVDGLNSLPLLLGSLIQGPFPLGKPEIFRAQDIVRLVGTNVNLPDGDPNYWLGALVGWIMPE